MTLTGPKRTRPSDVDKQRLLGPAELAVVGLGRPRPADRSRRVVAGHGRRPGSRTARSTPNGATRASLSSSRPAGAVAAWAPSSSSDWRTKPPPAA